MQTLTPRIAALSVFLLAPLAAGPAQAGFLDDLFGRQPTMMRTYEAEPDPLDVTVRKRAAKRKPSVQELAPVVLQKPTLDPVKDPYWYLKDETLRRGDIVVLPNRVLVLREGGSSLRPSAFEDVRRSSGLSNRERTRIISMTEYHAGAAQKYKIVPETTVTAGAAISQIDRTSVPVIMP